MPELKRKPNYGQDSPQIVATLAVLSAASLAGGFLTHSGWRWVLYGLGAYFLLGAFGMLLYSKKGKLALCERLLNGIPWRGDERVLDVGCGRGLLAVSAARRLTSGTVVGVDVWNPRALSGNSANSVLENAEIEGISGKVEVKQGDARQLPFPDSSFDVVVSNYVVHELQDRADRERMMREVARVLKPGGRVALVDFIFTDECVADLQNFGLKATRERDGSTFSFWLSAILNFGALRTYRVLGTKL